MRSHAHENKAMGQRVSGYRPLIPISGKEIVLTSLTNYAMHFNYKYKSGDNSHKR